MRQEHDLPAVDAALLVDLAEIGFARLGDEAESRGRPAIGRGVANLDLGVCDAGTVFLLASRGLKAECQEHSGRDDACPDRHPFLRNACFSCWQVSYHVSCLLTSK